MKKYLFSSILLALFAIGFTASEDEEVDPSNPNAKISVVIKSPTTAKTYITAEEFITISGEAAANNGLQSVTFKTSTGLEGEAEGLEEWTIKDLPLLEGENVIEVTAKDKKGVFKTAKLTVIQGDDPTFLDVPSVDNDLLYTNELTELWITVPVSSTAALAEDMLTLVQVDNNDQFLYELGYLYDDGNLEHGDEIKGDGVFSMKSTFQFAEAGTKHFKVIAKLQSTEVASATFDIHVIDKDEAEAKINSLLEYKKKVEEKLTELVNSDISFDDIQTAVLVWLKVQDYVVTAELEGSIIKITYINGLSSYLFLDANQGVIKGDGNKRAATPSIPLNMQTRGTWQQYAATQKGKAKAPADMANIIQNKNVLIWSPFENNFVEDMEPVLGPILKNSPVGFNINYLKNEQCDVVSLCNLENYGVVIFDTHGLLGNMLITRQKVEDLASLGKPEQYKDYLYQYINGSYFLVTMAYYREDLQKNLVETFFAVTPNFFWEKIKKALPNTVIFNGSCESYMNTDFVDAFLVKGAKAYLGFSSGITVQTCNQKAAEFFTTLTGEDLKTTGEAYVADLNFTETYKNKSWTTSYLFAGSDKMHFTLGLINGDFEFGNLNGWNVDGDGRVITQLGFLKPTEGNYMGIISTGLGYTTAHGTIFQTFKVAKETTLSFNWNYLSEEFLEYIGSQYQDYFIVSIVDEDGNEEILLSKSVDQIAADFGAAHGVQGNLIPVSPEIVFDRGDVYMTGWLTSTFDISKYQGKNVTLYFKSHDVGDSIYDTAILLDEITVK